MWHPFQSKSSWAQKDSISNFWRNVITLIKFEIQWDQICQHSIYLCSMRGNGTEVVYALPVLTSWVWFWLVLKLRQLEPKNISWLQCTWNVPLYRCISNKWKIMKNLFYIFSAFVSKPKRFTTSIKVWRCLEAIKFV